jgi:hypothetical protein
MLTLASWPVWLSPWAWTSSDWAGLTFVVLVAALLVGRSQANEARRLRQEQARPFVIIDFHPWDTIIELKIKNLGSTLARDVQFEFDRAVTTTDEDIAGRGPIMQLNLFKNGIPSLAPGKEITVFFDHFPTRVDQGLPMTYNVRVSYRDNSGKRYAEPTVLDLTAYLGTGGVSRDDIHDVHKRLEEIAREVKRWTSIAGGIKVMTPEDVEQYLERVHTLRQERARRDHAASSETPDGRPGDSDAEAQDDSPA